MAELATLAALGLALAAGGFLAHRLHLPPAFGYLGMGVAVGALAPDITPHGIEALAEAGILVLLFLIGIELDLKRLRGALRATAWTMPFDIALPAVLTAGVARLAGWSFIEAAALGIAVAVSSTIFGERLTTQTGFQPPARQRVLGVLISEDVAAGALIALLVVMASGGGGLGAPFWEIGRTLFVLVLLAGFALLLVPRILDGVARRHVPELLVLWAVGLIALFAYLGTLAGTAELGALVAGVAAAEAGSRYVTRNSLTGLRDIAAALFFFASGVIVEPSAVVAAAGMAALVALAFLLGKHLVHVPAAIAGGLGLGGALQSAGALAAMGEFNLILVAVAEREGLAHPDLRAVVLGAMLVLLPLAALLTHTAMPTERRFWRLPERLRDPLEVLAAATRRRPGRGAHETAWKNPLRRFIANGLMLAGYALLVVWLRSRIPPIDAGPGWSDTAIWLGASVALALPLLVGTYRAYRALVWALVGLRPGERVGAGNVRARLVDAWVALSVVLVLAIISLWIPRTVPVLLGGASVAVLLGVVAWRRLNAFHRALESALGRVLGDDVAGARFLDQVLEEYPWGVRFAAVSVPTSSPVVGRSLKDSRIGALTGATIAAIQRNRQETVNPPSDTVLRAGDHLVLLGDGNQLSRAEALIVAHGDAVRMSAQSLAAEVEEIIVMPESPWVGQTFADIRIRETTGTLIVGRWRDGFHHPQPFRPDLHVAVGDRLIVLGTPLQLQRARILAEGIDSAAA